MNIRIFNKNEFLENTYLLKSGNDAYIIDPGCCYRDISFIIEQESLGLKGVFLTHGHFDHICEVNNYPKSIVWAHEKEKKILANPDLNLSAWAGINLSVEEINYFQNKEAKIKIFKAIHTPGHTEGCVVYLVDNMLFTGDTLFFDTIGRTDLPSGDTKQIKESLLIFKSLDPEIVCYPGHGEPFKLKEAFEYNQFLSK